MRSSGGEDLLQQLRHKDAIVRRQAARTLGAAKRREGLKELCNVLADDPSAAVRRAAAEALGKIGDAAAQGPLERAMRSDASDDVRRAAAAALARLGGTGDTPATLPTSQE